MKSNYRPYAIRLLFSLVVSILLAAAINEGIYLIQREPHDRPPKTMQIVVPAGTADRIAAGEAGPVLPENEVFVVGDILEVKNEDSVSHQLGPIWVPAGASSRLVLDKPERYSYACSFSTSQYFGLDVREATTLGTRITALAISAPSIAVFIFIYGLLVYPIKPGEPARPDKSRDASAL